MGIVTRFECLHGFLVGQSAAFPGHCSPVESTASGQSVQLFQNSESGSGVSARKVRKSLLRQLQLLLVMFWDLLASAGDSHGQEEQHAREA